MRDGGDTVRWWIFALSLVCAALGWTYKSLYDRVDEIQRVQAKRGEDIARLEGQMAEMVKQLGVMNLQHHEIEQELMKAKR